MALVLGAAIGPGAMAWAEVKPGEESGLGLVGPETPDVLKQAEADPYRQPASCAEVGDELAALDHALGPDADEPKAKSRGVPIVGVVKSLIPYRAVVRLVTGAGKKEKALTQAAMAGSARRGYLRGLQASCAAREDAAVTANLNAAVVPGKDAASYTSTVGARPSTWSARRDTATEPAVNP